RNGGREEAHMSTVAEETFTGGVSGDTVTLATSSFSTFSGGTADALKFDSTILGPGPSMSAIYAGGIRQARWNITAAGTIKGRFFAQFNTNPPVQAVFAGMRGAGANLCQLQIQNAGTIRIMNVAAAVD